MKKDNACGSMHAPVITRSVVTSNMSPDETGRHTLYAQVFHQHAYPNMNLGSL